MSMSLQMLWSLVNTLQLVTHVALFSIVLPSNLLTFYSILIEAANFELLPSESIINSILSFREEDPSHSVNFELMGYESSNAIKNLGSVFLVFCFSLGMIVVVGLIQLAYLGCSCFRNSET